MKLIRVGPIGHEKPALLRSDVTFVDISDLTRDVDGSFLERPNVADLCTVVASRLADGQERSLEGRRIGAPIACPHWGTADRQPVFHAGCLRARVMSRGSAVLAGA